MTMGAVDDRWIGFHDALQMVMEKKFCGLGSATGPLESALKGGAIRMRGATENGPVEIPREVQTTWVGIFPIAHLGRSPLARHDLVWNGRSDWEEDFERTIFIEMAAADLERWLDGTKAPAPPGPAKNKGGKPRKHDRDAFHWKVISIADLDALPDDSRELTSRMLKWCQDNWGDDAPEERTVRQWVTDIYANRRG